MYERLERLYVAGDITQNDLLTAVSKGWLTKAEYEQMTTVEDNSADEFVAEAQEAAEEVVETTNDNND